MVAASITQQGSSLLKNYSLWYCTVHFDVAVTRLSLYPHSAVLQASLTSALAFSLGAGLPLLAGAFIADAMLRVYIVIAATTVSLVLFGGLGAWLGGAALWKGSLRVLLGGWIAMAITYGIGMIFNVQA